jgi:hypothetical protein
MELKPFTCPHCSLTTPRTLKNTRLISCSCLTVSSLDDTGRVEKFKKLRHSIKNFTPDWLKNGCKIEYNLKEYTATGIFSYSATWQEWNANSKRWDIGTSTSREYYFRAENDFELCLMAEEGRFFIRHEITNLDEFTKSKFFDEEMKNIFEKGDFVLSAFIGEDDEPLDEQKYFYQVYSDINGDIIGEGTEEDFRQKKLRFYRKTLLSIFELESLHVKYNPKFAELISEHGKYNFLRKVSGIPALIFLVFWINSYQFKDQYIKAGSSSFKILMKVDENSGQPKSMFSCNLEKEKNYTMLTNCYFSESEGEVEIALSVIKKPENKLINAINCSFYSESGYDNEGSWTESVVTDDFQFKVPESGEYEFIATPLQGYDPTDAKYSKSWTSGNFKVFIHETKVSRWYGLMFLLSIFAWLITQWKWENISVLLGLPIQTPITIIWDYLKK